MKAIIPAAGLGTRFLPIAKAVPKEMLPIGDRPVIHYVVEEAFNSGFDEILLILSRGKEIIAQYFAPHPELERHLEQTGKTAALEAVQATTRFGQIHSVYQPEMRGLGDALRLARSFVGRDEAFAVLLGDTLTHGSSPLPAMRNAWEETGKSSVCLEPCPTERVSRYGIAGGRQLPRDADTFELSELIEKPPADSAPVLHDPEGRPLPPHAFAARYLFANSILDDLDTTPPGFNGEIQLTDAMRSLLDRDGLLGITWPGERLDIGNPAGLLEANQRLQN
ncbi:MAG: sugar phosphate nucleotidyltransferase [Chthoniobacterales bacterium]